MVYSIQDPVVSRTHPESNLLTWSSMGETSPTLPTGNRRSHGSRRRRSLDSDPGGGSGNETHPVPPYARPRPDCHKGGILGDFNRGEVSDQYSESLQVLVYTTGIVSVPSSPSRNLRSLGGGLKFGATGRRSTTEGSGPGNLLLSCTGLGGVGSRSPNEFGTFRIDPGSGRPTTPPLVRTQTHGETDSG